MPILRNAPPGTIDHTITESESERAHARGVTHARGTTGQRQTGRIKHNTIRRETCDRWNQCVTLLNAARRQKDRKALRWTWGEIGVMLAEESGWRKSAYDPAITFRMASGERAIRLEDCQAMARVLLRFDMVVDPGWIAYGDDSLAPSPPPEKLAAARKTLRTM